MSIDRILGLIGLLIAIVAAFFAIPYVALALLVIGLIVGYSIAREDHVRVIVSALALTAFWIVDGGRGDHADPAKHLCAVRAGREGCLVIAAGGAVRCGPS